MFRDTTRDINDEAWYDTTLDFYLGRDLAKDAYATLQQAGIETITFAMVLQTAHELGELLKGAHSKLTIKKPISNQGRHTGAGGYLDAADQIYDTIRSSTTDVANISKSTGIKPENIQKVKEHIFLSEHTLDRYVELGIPAEKARFDSDIKIAEAWKRLEAGTYVPDDIQLLKHEVAERWIELKRNCGYCEAHDRASINYPAPNWWE